MFVDSVPWIVTQERTSPAKFTANNEGQYHIEASSLKKLVAEARLCATQVRRLRAGYQMD